MSIRINPAEYLSRICQAMNEVTPEDITTTEAELFHGLSSTEVKVGELTNEDMGFKRLLALRDKIDHQRIDLDPNITNQTDMEQTKKDCETAKAYEAEVKFLDNMIDNLLWLSFDSNNPNAAMYYLKAGWVVVKSVNN